MAPEKTNTIRFGFNGGPYNGRYDFLGSSLGEKPAAKLRDMIPRALRAGFKAQYALSDAWFGCKKNVACCLGNQLTAIFQMKRGNLTYQYQGHSYTASQLYAKVQRHMRPKNRRARYKTASLVVRLNLETNGATRFS